MPDPSKKPRLFHKLLFIATLAMIFLSIGLAAFHKTPWQVPFEEKMRKNPLAASDANLNAAKPLYNEYCVNCHGDSGKGDGSDAMMYDPAPSDLTDTAHMNKLTDGEIYYQITQGRKPMPSFRNKLTEEQRWQLVTLVRALSGAVVFPPRPAKTPEPPAPKKARTSRKTLAQNVVAGLQTGHRNPRIILTNYAKNLVRNCRGTMGHTSSVVPKVSLRKIATAS